MASPSTPLRSLVFAVSLCSGLCNASLSRAEPKSLPAEVEDNWDALMGMLSNGDGPSTARSGRAPGPAASREAPSSSAPVVEARQSTRDTTAREASLQARAPRARASKAAESRSKAPPAWGDLELPSASSKPARDVAPTPAASALDEGEGAPTIEEQPTKRPGRKTRKQALSKKKKPRDERSKPIKRGVSASYQALRARWHEEAPRDEAYLSETTPALVFQVVGEATPYVVLVPEESGGPFDADQLEVARAAFRGAPGTKVNERLLGLIYRATQHFQVPYVHLVSGIRRDRGASRHTHGLAADIVLPGVEDEDVADFFRAQGFIGVGVYTRAGFVHVDVRDRSFFWVDPSPPGKTMKIRPVRMAEAKAADEAAIARGEEPFVNPPRLSRALAKRSAQRRVKLEKKVVKVRKNDS